MQAKPKLYKSFSYLTISNIVAIPATALITVLIAKYLKPYELGLFMTGEAFVEMFSFFFTMGFKNSIYQYAANQAGDFRTGLREAMGNALLVRLLIGIPVGVLVYFLGVKFNQDVVLVKIIGLYVIKELLMSMSNIFGIVRRALDQFKLIAVISASNQLIKLALVFVVCQLLNGGLMEVVYAFVLMELIKFLISFIATINLIRPSLAISKIPEMMKESVLYGIFDFLDTAQNKIDRLMINYFLGPAAVAFYSIPSRLNRLIRVIPNSLKQVFLPQLHQAQDPASLKPIVSKLRILLLVTGLPLALGIYFLSKPVLAKFFSSEYQTAIELAPLFAFIALIWFLNIPPDMLLASRGDHKGRNLIQVISIVLNIALNWFLIPRFGIIGAIAATIAANFFKFVLFQLRYSISFDQK